MIFGDMHRGNTRKGGKTGNQQGKEIGRGCSLEKGRFKGDVMAPFPYLRDSWVAAGTTVSH